MSSLRAVMRNSSVLFAGTAASKALVLLSTLVLVRALGPEDFGLYTLVFAWLAFLELLPDAGLDPLAVREAAQRPRTAATVLGDALALRGVLALAAFPLAVVGVRLVTDDPRGPALAALGAICWIGSVRRPSLRSLLELPYRLALRMDLPTGITVLAEAAHLAWVVALVADHGLPAAVAAQGVTALPFAAVLAVLAVRRLRPSLRLDPGRLIATAGRSAPIFGLLLANVVLVRADVLMLEWLRGSRDVGIYAAPTRIVEVANLLPGLLLTSLYPLFAATWPVDPARTIRLYRVSLRVLAAAAVPIIVVEAIWAGPIVSFLFGAEFAESAGVLPVLAATLLLMFADIVMNSFLLATGSERRNLQLVVVAAAANVVANLALIPAHGAVGAAWATLLAYTVRMLGALVPRETRGAALVAIHSIAPGALAGGAAAAVLLWSGRSLAGTVLAAATFVGILAITRGLTRAEFGEIAGALRRRPR
jgi:O-antigen/teichoic acid export membrane protein